MHTSFGETPHFLVYKTKVVIPTGDKISSLQSIVKAKIKDTEWVKTRLEKLALIDKKRLTVVYFGQLYQQRMACAYNKKVHPRHFEVGQLVLQCILPHQEGAKGKFAKIGKVHILSRKYCPKEFCTLLMYRKK